MVGGVADGVRCRASQVGVLLLLLTCLEVTYNCVVLQAVPTVAEVAAGWL